MSESQARFAEKGAPAGVGLLGCGTAVPAHTMSQQQAAEMACDICCQTDHQRRLLRVLYRKAGVLNRHTVVPYTTAYQWVAEGPPDTAAPHQETALGPCTEERMRLFEAHALPLATQAATRALRSAGLGAKQISHLVTVTCTGFVAPGVDIHLMKTLGFSRDVERIGVGFMGCHGAINGLRAARGLVMADPRALVLLCAVEVCSMHYRFRWDPERFLGNALFADGAGALVLGHTARAGVPSWQVAGTGSSLFPDSCDAMSWRVGDHGFEMTLSAEVPALIQGQLRDWLVRWLHDQGLRLDDVQSWAVHPGGPRILSAVEECLGLPREATSVSHEVLAEFGNMSSPTILFILERLRQQGAAPPCLLLGFGPGLVAEVALLR